MKFPLSEINRQDYLDKIYQLIQDDDCQIFVDTNIFALFYRINNSARTEFFDWLTTLMPKKRVKTPLWALNEYTNRFIRNQIEDYFGPLKKVKSIQNDFTQLSTFLKMNIDSTSIESSKYSSLEDFNNDLDFIDEKLSKIKLTAKSKDETYKLKIHTEIKQLFEQTVLESDLSKILELTKKLGDFRYNHKLPPGFQDGVKELNSFGDLIIWNEIIEHCCKNGVKKGILLTNDLKKDWVYSPNRIIENSRNIPNKDGQFKIIDPRLVYEFKSKTNSEDFHIISFDTLTQILLQNNNSKFIELAKALQLDSSNKVVKVEDSDDDIENDNKSKSIEESKPELKETIPSKKSEFEYSKIALSDRDFPLNDSSFYTNTIIDLKSHNWYKQNPAIDELLDYPESKIQKDDDTANKLFVLGRNIYQSAQGGSAAAVDYLNNLRDIFTKHSDFYINHIFTGMLYEVYFDSMNQFREYNYKSSFLDEIYSLEDLDRLELSFTRVKKFLEPYKDYLLYLPYQENVEIKINFEQDLKEVKPEWGEPIKMQSISSILVDDKDLLTTNFEDSIQDYHYYLYDLDVNEVINLISNVYGIPSSKITHTTSAQSEIKLDMGDKRLKKLVTIE
ncbi:PIN-like domain-containing protein [Cellulophaga baltica]|uniref:PIN-like domain-containing protein n=1 Tax=Cellulophaga baltica TaxID=76594 RepID=UPI0037C5B44F